MSAHHWSSRETGHHDRRRPRWRLFRRVRGPHLRSEEHTSELQSHSDLHPFPTRRSSDLGAVATRIASGAVKQTIPSQDQTGCRVLSGHISKSEKPCQRTIGRHAKQGTTTEGAPGGGYSVECVVRTLDRKSTRLNSSHTVIYTLSLHDALPISAP